MCVEKPLCSLWKNYTCNQKPDVHMKLTVTQSGLKAFTKEHGLTEYWSHRVTYCLASPQYPRVFCWVYRHEGRKLKQELRCHAVVCTKESVARQIACQLQNRLAQALSEFKRDKISRQNARLSLANSVYENPSLPRRKILLSTGSHNYRPPLERSKSAPRLMSIEESLEEEEEPQTAVCGLRGRCRADNRLRTGTLRNRLGGLRDGYAASQAKTAEPVEKTAAAVKPPSILAEIEKRLADAQPSRDLVVTTSATATAATTTVTAKPEPVTEPVATVTDDETVEQPCAAAPTEPAVGLPPSPPPNVCVELLMLPLKYNETVVECPQGPDDMCFKYNSLVRDRKRLFEGVGGGAETSAGRRERQFKRMNSDSELQLSGPYGSNLVKNRKLLFEGPPAACCLRSHHDDDDDDDANCCEDLAAVLAMELKDLDLDEEKDCGYPDDESTPSLQSISSGGSDGLCVKKSGAMMDLDSLSEEEDSDESGYVEAPPSKALFCSAADDDADDKKHHPAVAKDRRKAHQNALAAGRRVAA